MGSPAENAKLDLFLTNKANASNSVYFFANIEIINLNQVPISGNSVVEPITYKNDQYYLAAFNNARSQLSADLGNSYLV